MIIVENPTLDYVKAKDRLDGISAMMRIKNGDDLLESSILSVIEQVDEIICVFNDSQDDTEKILLELESKYPNKIFVFKYIPIVYPPNSEDYKKCPANTPNALCYYYNFALSKTKYSHVFKLDDDQLFFPNILRKWKDDVSGREGIGLKGMNLTDYNEKLYVNHKCEKFTEGSDIILFKYNDDCHFIKTEKYELFKGCGCGKGIRLSHYHLKRCKRDRGINNYNLHTNPTSRYMGISKWWFSHFTKENLVEITKNDELPDPYKLGFQHVNNSIKEYNCEVFTELEEKLKLTFVDI